MGAIHFSIDPKLVRAIQTGSGREVFVETGTFEGDAVAAVVDAFPTIHTIELSDAYVRRAGERFAGVSHVHVHHGDSPNVLTALRAELVDTSALYWLDAHWCERQSTAGAAAQCPLLRELEAIGELNDESAILIDDARLFLAPPPEPHDVSAWPTYDELRHALDAVAPRHQRMIVDDVVAVYPAASAAAIHDHARRKGFDLLALANRERALEVQVAELEAISAERLQLIDEISRVAEERLGVIDELKAAAADRLAALEECHRELQRREDEWEGRLRALEEASTRGLFGR